jgi:hypothetical protein
MDYLPLGTEYGYMKKSFTPTHEEDDNSSMSSSTYRDTTKESLLPRAPSARQTQTSARATRPELPLKGTPVAPIKATLKFPTKETVSIPFGGETPEQNQKTYKPDSVEKMRFYKTLRIGKLVSKSDVFFSPKNAQTKAQNENKPYVFNNAAISSIQVAPITVRHRHLKLPNSVPRTPPTDINAILDKRAELEKLRKVPINMFFQQSMLKTIQRKKNQSQSIPRKVKTPFIPGMNLVRDKIKY